MTFKDYMSLKNETKEKKGNRKSAIFSKNSQCLLRFQTLEISVWFILRDTPHKNNIPKFWAVIY